jgi:hypothetical protein
MHQAHARVSRDEDQQEVRRGRPQLRSVERERDRTDDRERARNALRDLELELGADDVLAAPTHRRARTTGAAANYARSDSSSTRRTIEIRGHGAPTATSLRPTPSELRGPRPDRIAGWAVGLGMLVAVLAAIL